MTRRRALAEHGLIFATALLTLPLAAAVGSLAGAFLAALVLVAGVWVALAATLRLQSVTALIPTIAAMVLLCAFLAFAALSDPSAGSTCASGQTGFMDGCGIPAETMVGAIVVSFVVLTGALCFVQLLTVPAADAIRARRPPSARLPIDERTPAPEER